MNSDMHVFSDRAQWLCAPVKILGKIPVLRNAEFPDAPFLYGRMYIRQHLRRIFTLETLPETAFCSFSCENKFDVFLNGKCIHEKDSECAKKDILPYLKKGGNLLLLRIYQTASPDHIVSAVTGGLRFLYADGMQQEILTDHHFRSLWLATFWNQEESADFAVNPSCGKESPVFSGPVHPRSLRRSLLFRKEFEITKPVAKAVLRGTASCMGLFSINGEDADDAVLQPGATEKRREYREFDLTNRLNTGKNVIAAITGNGWSNCESWGTLDTNRNAVIADLKIVYQDGSCEEIVSDTTWRAAFSPLVENDLQFGERYDANAEIPGWNKPGEPSGNWFVPDILSDTEKSVIPPLHLQEYPPVRAIREYPLRLVRELEKGTFPAVNPQERAWLYTVDRNIAGSIRLKFRNLRKGQKTGFYFCERLHENGAPNTTPYGAVVYPQDSLPGNIAPFNLRGYSQYTAAGRPEETFSTRFTYTGFRYVIVAGLDEAPGNGDIKALELHSDLTPAGSFSSGSEALNKIWNATVQSWNSNCFNGPTDCPTREKNFWNGDTQIFSHAACWITDNEAFLGNWTRYGRKLEAGVYGWEDEIYELPYTLYQFYGNKEILREQYPAMLELLQRRTEFPGMILPEHPHSPYRDWLNPTGRNISTEFFSDFWYLRMLDRISHIAGILGDRAKEEELRAAFEAGKKEFLKRHFDEKEGRFKEHFQCSYVLALKFNLLPEAMRKPAAEILVRMIRERGYQTTGFHGTRYLFEVLSGYGYAGLALHLLERKEFPSWLYMLEGISSIPESWYGARDKDSSISMAHFSFGACCAWFFEYLGGISLDESEPGLKKITLRPHAVKGIGHLDIRYRMHCGEIRSSWKFVNGKAEFSWSAPEGIEVNFIPETI